MRKQLSNDQTASIYADQFFSSVADNKEAEKSVFEILISGIERYKHLDAIKAKIDDPGDFSQVLVAALRFFPSFGFILCNELDKRPDYYEYTKKLRISTAASCIARKVDYQITADVFMNQMEPESSLEQMDSKLTEVNAARSYFPRILYQDFIQLCQTQPHLKTSTNPHDLIETTYYFKSVKQVFLKYYFYLLGSAANDMVAIHVNKIFSRLLLTLRAQELNYWGKYKGGKKLKGQLLVTISKDLAKSRHPQLRKHIFEGIDKFNPVIQDGTLNTTVIEVRQLLAKQLAIFYDLSINKLVLMLDITQKTEGGEYVTFLLSQLSRTNIGKLFDLKDHLESLSSDKTKALKQLVSVFSDKLPGAKKRQHQATKEARNSMATVYKTADSLRTVHAKKRLIESEGKRGMRHDHVPRFLEERLKKLFAKAKKEGALTKDKIADYLAKFAAIAELMVNPIPEEEQAVVIKEFKETTDEILNDISDEGQLSKEEVEDFREDIKEKAEELDTADLEQRIEIVDEIGVTLSEASFQSDKRNEADGIEEFLSKDIIPYGLDKKAKRISIGEFFTFPFGDFNGPNDEDWFSFHMRYLQMAVKEQKLDKSNFVKIFNSLSHLPRIKYKKYFNIFPNEQFEETTFMAVYDLWQNKAFERLRAD